jgi:hypothetical protein
MRTVSFSSDPVRRLLNGQFVCALINTEGDPNAGSSCAHAPTDTPGPCARGIGHQNVQCLVLTPKGEIVHAASGYLGPDDLTEELDFALKTFAAVKKSPARGKRHVADVHARRLKDLGYDDADIQGPRRTLLQEMLRPGGLAAGGRLNNVQDVFAHKTRRTVLNDHKFSVRHPLLPFKEFASRPQLLVGTERTAFSSTSNGTPSGGRIGN